MLWEATLSRCWTLSLSFHCPSQTIHIGVLLWAFFFFYSERGSSRLKLCMHVFFFFMCDIWDLYSFKGFYLSLCRVSVGETVPRNQQMSGKENSLTEIWLMIQKVRFDPELNASVLLTLSTLQRGPCQSHLKNSRQWNMDCPCNHSHSEFPLETILRSCHKNNERKINIQRWPYFKQYFVFLLVHLADNSLYWDTNFKL